MKRGISGLVYRSFEYGGYGLQLIKYENGKQYRVDIDNLKWIECSEYQMIPSIMMSEFEDARSEGEKGNLHGENLALKNEIAFLREQIANLLGKV